MEKGRLLGIEVDIATSFAERSRGLIARPKPPPGHGFLIPHCNAIHTFFMRYPIDVIFLDRNDRVIREVKNIRPWRLLVWGGFKAVKVIETASAAQS